MHDAGRHPRKDLEQVSGSRVGVFGPIGVVLLALLPSRKEPSVAVRRLEEKGLIGHA